MSDKTEAERRALPWYDPEAIPRAESDATHCRHPDCPDTNWGGRDRIHTRGEDCPPLPTAADQPTTEPSLHERIADTLAYYHCRAVNPKADHPRTGYHAMSEDQRQFLRGRQDEAAAEVVRIIQSLAPAPQPVADTERRARVEAHRRYSYPESSPRARHEIDAFIAGATWEEA